MTVVRRGIVRVWMAAPGRIVSVLMAAPWRTVGVLAVAVVCLLVSVAALAQPAAVQVEAVGSAAAEEVEPVGFRLEGEEVVFTFDRNRYGVVTRGDNGQRVAIIDIELSERSGVAVAGEFNGWSTDAWMMELKEPGVYELRRPLEQFGGQGAWAFKFVIDGMLWVEPPAWLSRRLHRGLSPATHTPALALTPAAGTQSIRYRPMMSWRADTT